jgi:hypothetical protein
MTAIHLDGRVFCSNAVLDGKFELRACIVNFRTEAEDVDAVLDVAAKLGSELDAELAPGVASRRRTHRDPDFRWVADQLRNFCIGNSGLARRQWARSN